MYPSQPSQVRVPITLEAVGVDIGADLVARIGQPGIYGYSVLRVWITGPAGATFQLYKGSTSNPPFTSVYSGGVADAQFQPGESIPPGNDIIGVWVSGAGQPGRMVVTTDGGA
jgi:hypothetical protein